MSQQEVQNEANLITRERATAIIESLRAGIPTRTSTKELPDLRHDLTETIWLDLAELSEGKSPQGRLIWGAYGQGKTHALTTIEHTALEEGFAVSRVSLSREVSCHQLFNFYGRVAAGIRIPHSKVLGMQRALEPKTKEDLFSSLTQNHDRYLHPLPAIVFENYFYTTGEERDLLYGDLMGTRLSTQEIRRIYRASHNGSFPKMRSFTISKDGAAYFGVMADALAWCGYKAWIILIDEVELIGRLGKIQRLQAYQNLNWLLNWSGKMPYPIYTIGAVATSLKSDVWMSNNEKRKPKTDYYQIPEIALARHGEEVATEMREFFTKAMSSHCPTLEPPDSNNRLALLQKLVEMHGIAYNWEAHLDIQDVLDSLGNQPLRTYIRAILEALDLVYVYSEGIIPTPDRLVESSLIEGEGEK